MGGPAGEAVVPADASSTRHPAALQAFPSPASVTGPLDSPTLSRSLAGRRPSAQWTPRSLLPDSAGLVPPAPGDVILEPAATPPAPGTVEPDLNIMVGGALAPMHTTPPERPKPRRGPGLRLPSFEALGIAPPHPDWFCQISPGRERLISPLDVMDGSSASTAHDDGDLVDDVEHLTVQRHDSVQGAADPEKPGGGRAVQTAVRHFIATLTPPAEAGEMVWRPPTAVPPAPVDPPSTRPGNAMQHPRFPHATTDGSVAAGGRHISTDHCPTNDKAWIDGAVHTLLQNIESAQRFNNPLRVLSHALPSPSPSGHIFPTVISAIHNTSPTTPTVWINVFHALPGRFNLADLPTSPPATPGPPIGGDDYFTQKVFDSAVPISDYSDDLSSLPRSPRPIVPPSSINISIVERYIPPTTTNEFADMFSETGPSILVDRLVELSPNNGCLTFIYPTRCGAKRFMNEYLGPIWDPLLRSMCVVHGLPSNLSRTLGSMLSVDRLDEHEDLERQMTALCSKLTQRSTGMQRFHSKRAAFSLIYAAKKDVHIEREVWARDWWTRQEKARIRSVVSHYAQEAQKKSSNEHMDRPATAAELMQQLLDGVCKKPYAPGQEPTRGIEVSVFVIRRSE